MRGGWRGSIAPELVDQAIDRHDVVGVQEQQREQGASLSSSELERPSAGDDLERTEEAEFERGCRDIALLRIHGSGGSLRPLRRSRIERLLRVHLGAGRILVAHGPHRATRRQKEVMKTSTPTSILHRTGLHVIGVAVVFSLMALLALSTPAGATNGSSVPRATTSAAPAGTVVVDTVSKRCKKRLSGKCKRGTGARRPKKRIKPVRPSRTVLAGLPGSVDLTTGRVPTGDQGQIGSCVAWAIDYAMLGWYSRKTGKAGQPFHPMYTYSQIKSPEGGSDPNKALSVAQTQGNDTVAHYHGGWSSILDDQTQPNASERANAANYKISGSKMLFSSWPGGGGTNGAAMIQTQLAAGRPVAIMLRVSPGFSNLGTRASLATATVTDVNGSYKNLHEVLALGYDQTGLVIQNSWGTRYGYQGLARLSWQFVAKDVHSAHIIYGFANSNPTPPPPPPPPPGPAPAMGPVAQQFALDHSITSTTAPVTVRWSASSNSGIAAYEVAVKTGNGDFNIQNIPSNATQYTWALSAGQSYQVRVRARSTADVWSGYSYSQTITPSFTDDTAFGISSPWGRYNNVAGTFGGTYIASSQAGSSATLTFTGTESAFIPVKFSTAGRYTVYCDNTPLATGDLYSASTVVGQVAAFCHFTQRAQHTMKIVAEGTSGRPWLSVDAFAAL